MSQNSNSEGSDREKRVRAAALPENIIIVSDISIIAEYIDAVFDMETRSFDPPWNKKDFIDELQRPDALVLLLLERGIPRGYLCSRKVFDETHLNKICIHHDARGCGYGKMLLGSLVGMLSGSPGKIYLEVASTNFAAIGLYEKTGFRRNRVRCGIYENGDDAFEMVLELRSVEKCPGESDDADTEK